MANLANREIISRLYGEVLANPVPPAVKSLIDAGYVDHNNEGAGRGPAVFIAHVEALRRTFPDFSVEIVDMIADGDKVVTRVRGRGTHTGVWMGIQPTGHVVELRGINIDRIADGRVVEHWGEADTIGMLMQMGVDPFARRAAGR